MEFEYSGNNNISQLTNDAFVMKDAGVLITFANEGKSDKGKTAIVPGFDNKRNSIKRWGSDNLLPQRRELILEDNNIVGNLMTTKRDIILGSGLYPYVEDIAGEGVNQRRVKIPVLINPEIEDWLGKAEFYKTYLEPATDNLLKHGNILAGMMVDRRKNDKHISSVKAHQCTEIRALKEKGKPVSGYLHHDHWPKPTLNYGKFTHMPLYNHKSTTLSMYHTGDRFFNDGVYNSPVYWGGKEWIELANIIPKFHKTNLRNGYVLRYHIQIPNDYFLDKARFLAAGTNEKKQKKCIDRAKRARQKFLDDLNNVLAGVENAGRTITSTTTFNEFTKQYEGITIEPITVDLQDEKLLKLFNSSNEANISGQGIHPTLANIESQGKLSSGSEMRNAFNFYVAVKTQTPRRQLLEAWNLVVHRNGWSKHTHDGKIIKWHFEDTVLSKLDDDKSGTSKPQVESK